MKIIIDTKEDSRVEIEKAAKLLLELAGTSPQTEFSPEVSEGAFGLFDEKKEEEPKKEPFNINKVIEY